MKKAAREDGYQLDGFVVGVQEVILPEDEEELPSDPKCDDGAKKIVKAKPLQVKEKILNSKSSGVGNRHCQSDNQYLEDLIGEDTDVSVHEYDSDYYEDSDSDDNDDYIEEKPISQPKSKASSTSKATASPANPETTKLVKKDVIAERFLTTKQGLKSTCFEDLKTALIAPRAKLEQVDERPARKARLTL